MADRTSRALVAVTCAAAAAEPLCAQRGQHGDGDRRKRRVRLLERDTEDVCVDHPSGSRELPVKCLLSARGRAREQSASGAPANIDACRSPYDPPQLPVEDSCHGRIECIVGAVMQIEFPLHSVEQLPERYVMSLEMDGVRLSLDQQIRAKRASATR